jgi:hypothetical protein
MCGASHGRVTARICVVLCLSCLASCVEHGELAEAMPRERETINVAASGRAPIDVLVVMDDSCYVPTYQPRVAAAIRRLTAALDAAAGDADLRFGVVTTSLGTANVSTGLICPDYRGELQTHGCADLTDDYLVNGVDAYTGERITNYTGTLDEALRCMVNVDVAGCGIEQPFEAMRIALETPGFLRPEADLVVLLVSNEDDTSASTPAYFTNLFAEPGGADFLRFRHGVICDPDEPDTAGIKTGCRSREDSAYLHPVARYVDFLRGLKSDPSRITIGGIFGPPSPVEVVALTTPTGLPYVDLTTTCRDPDGEPTGDALPAVRLAELVGAFGDRGAASSVCGREYPVLDAIGALALDSSTRAACFAEAVADSSAAPGFQPMCEVELIVTGLDPLPVGACRGETSPLCWQIALDSEQCPDGGHYGVELVGSAPLPAHTRVRATCDVE